MAVGGFGGLQQLGNQSIGQSIGYGISKAQAGDAFNLWKKSLKRGPSYAAIGLERAGINRILAAGGGVGATSAAGSLKLNPAGMGSPGGGKPGVEAATAQALSAQAKAANSQAGLADISTTLRGNENVEAEWRAAFYKTPEGMALLKAGEMKKHLPDTWSGIATRGAWSAAEFLKKSNQLRRQDSMGNKIVPPNNSAPHREFYIPK